jgi:hypothetical protein
VSDTTALPAYAGRDIARLDASALMALMVHDEDRMPRNVIDTCAARSPS